MHPATTLVCFGIRQVIGVDVQMAEEVRQNSVIQSRSSTVFVSSPGHRERYVKVASVVALAGNGLMDKVKITFLASGDEKAFREQVNRFMSGKGVAFEGSTEQFRAACLTELNQARKTKPHGSILSLRDDRPAGLQ